MNCDICEVDLTDPRVGGRLERQHAFHFLDGTEANICGDCAGHALLWAAKKSFEERKVIGGRALKAVLPSRPSEAEGSTLFHKVEPPLDVESITITSAFSPGLNELAKQAAEASAKRNAELEAMSPEDREKAIGEWAEKLAEDSVAIGEKDVEAYHGITEAAKIVAIHVCADGTISDCHDMKHAEKSLERAEGSRLFVPREALDGLKERLAEAQRQSAALEWEAHKEKAVADLLRKEREGEVWAWDPDGDNHVESLTCPIVIHPEDMKKLVPAEALRVAMKEASEHGEEDGTLRHGILVEEIQKLLDGAPESPEEKLRGQLTKDLEPYIGKVIDDDSIAEIGKVAEEAPACTCAYAQNPRDMFCHAVTCAVTLWEKGAAEATREKPECPSSHGVHLPSHQVLGGCSCCGAKDIFSTHAQIVELMKRLEIDHDALCPGCGKNIHFRNGMVTTMPSVRHQDPDPCRCDVHF